MSDLQQYINNRKAREPEFAQNFEEGYQAFKIGFLLKQAREEARLTQEEVAKQLNLKTATISRIENHSEEIKLSTLERVASALGKRIDIAVNNSHLARR
ncbi:transcriptional regulator, XRE family [Candidatus Vecturithrix granuli]|uniref:Transcriptional regulator, XRE family n=1 Tax=Vecturithrix granuli TaxID=1499967 RepID=A0A081C492_VECG1|nr:transcriptional regulator, XRE family [Candidatus Vecturithrix granuli]